MNLQNSGEGCRENAEVYPPIMPAQAGIQYSEALVIELKLAAYWIPAFAGMTASPRCDVAPLNLPKTPSSATRATASTTSATSM